MTSPTNASRAPRWKAAAPAPASAFSGDFHQLLSFDLSPLEKRLEEVFTRLDALEQTLAALSGHALADADDDSVGKAHSATSAPTHAPTDESQAPGAKLMRTIDKGDLAKELDELRTTQLRLKIRHELAQATYKVDMEALKRELNTLPQHADLHNFRAEMDVQLTSTMKSLSDQQMLLWQDVERSLACRDLAENEWKAHFENSMDTRIQDVWAGLQGSQHKVDEMLGSLQVDMCNVEATTRETVDTVDVMQRMVKDIEKRTTAQNDKGVSHDQAIAQLHALLRQTNGEMVSQDTALQSAIDTMRDQLESAKQRHTLERDAYNAFVANVEKTLRFCASEIQTTIPTAIQCHQDKLKVLDSGLTTLGAEMKACQDQSQKADSRLGSLDGRLVQQEKQSVTLAHMLHEQQHEMNCHVGDLHKSLETAMQDRVSIKRGATELSFMIEEAQQALQEVHKKSSTTEMLLTRTTAEIPKLHILATTNTANIAKSQQAITDLKQDLVSEKKFSHQLQQNFDNEIHSSVARFADLHRCDEAAQRSIAATNSTMHHLKHALEEAVKYNSNMIHQLNTMVDSLAITESPTGMEDKLARFALETAELGLKLEYFVASTPGGGVHTSGTTDSGVVLVRDEVKAELAVLLTKIIRFLGSNILIEQNKYFLSASKLSLPSLDPTSGALVFELPASNILEQIRSAKVALFVTKMRVLVDQVRPVAQTVRHIHDFRDNFERKVRYVIEFGLANLFPNRGRPRNPNCKNPSAGTCIACDRPLEDEDDVEIGRGCMRMVETLDPEVEAVEGQKQRRNRLATSASVGNVSAGMTHKIDTRTAVRGRSGCLPPSSSTQQRPRSAMATSSSRTEITSGSVFHQPPGTNEYVYRAGFRLPRPSITGVAKTAIEDEIAGLHGLVMAVGCSGTPAQDDPVNLKQTLDNTVSSCLEKVALVGKHSNQMTSVAATAEASKLTTSSSPPIAKSPSPSQTVRPQTAPLRSQSLPRLEAVIERAAGQ